MENIFTHWESVINFTRNDIVFEHQNKQYGAYAIRKYYPERLRNAFLIATAGMILLFTVPLLLPKADKIILNTGTGGYVYEPIQYPPQKDPPNPSTPEPPKKTSGGIKITITNAPVAFQDSALEKNDTQNTEPSTGPVSTTGNSANTPSTNNNVVVPEPDPVLIAPVMPVFKGGDTMLDKFLRDNLRYPAIAREAGIKGRLYITFVIDKKGRVKNAVIRRGGLGGGLEEEALRVMHIMPDWEPGRNATGDPVSVQITLPINFVLR
jgi:protein TonB